MDLYIEAGVGSDAKYDLNDPGKIKIEIYAPTLKAGVGKDKKSILSGVLGIKYEVKIMDKKDALFKCPYIEELEFDIPAIIDFITGEETTTEEPTSETTENITETETQPVTEAPKPTEPVTQKPTEAPAPTEPVTEAPKPTEPALPQYELSAQTYEWAGGFGDNYYLVKVNGLYGVVDFNGNVKIPIQYEDYKEVGSNEVEFVLGNTSFVYNSNSFNLVYQYINKELIYWEIEKYEYYSPDGGNTIWNLYCALSDICTDCHIYRTYSNGVLIEALKYYDVYGNIVGVCNFYNTTTGEIILTDNGVSGIWSEIGIEHGSVFVSKNNNKIVFLSMDYATDCIYMYTIAKDGYQKTNINSAFANFRDQNRQYKLHELGIGFYESDWIKFAFEDNKVMFNVTTMEWICLPHYSTVNRFYWGKGLYVGLNIIEGGLYDLVKGNTIMSSGYEWLSFGEKYIRTRKNGVTGFVDYNTSKEIKQYINATGFNNGIALVDDGIGICYVNTSFNRVSDYVHIGIYDDFTSKTIKINGKYHLIQQK